MTREQAVRLLRAADALPEKIGSEYTFFKGAPCCAVGHLAAAIGFGTKHRNCAICGDIEVAIAFEVDTAPIVRANDSAQDSTRRAAVLAEIERQIRTAGHDPDALRAEVTAR